MVVKRRCHLCVSVVVVIGALKSLVNGGGGRNVRDQVRIRGYWESGLLHIYSLPGAEFDLCYGVQVERGRSTASYMRILRSELIQKEGGKSATCNHYCRDVPYCIFVYCMLDALYSHYLQVMYT